MSKELILKIECETRPWFPAVMLAAKAACLLGMSYERAAALVVKFGLRMRVA